jgi:glycosyltransferase involved in cell wall biosynthesis
VIKYLAQRHEITLVSFVRSEQERHDAQSLAHHCREVFTVPIHRSIVSDIHYLAFSLMSKSPFLVIRDNVAAMRRQVDDLLRRNNFDVVHADQLTMAQYAISAEHVHLGMANSPRTILDEHNAVWTIVRRMCHDTRWGPKRLLMELEWRKLRRYEGDLCRRFDRTLAVIEEDQQALEEAAGQECRITVIPIGVDTEQTKPILRQSEALDVISIATMYYPPNVDGILWFAREAFPTIKAKSPATKFYIVGARPPREVRELAISEPSIVVTDFVPDVSPLISQSAVSIVPVRAGSGMRVKILENFARGIPVVSTTVGKEGIAAEHERHLLLADEAGTFAAAVVRIIQDRKYADELASRARQLVEQRYDWRTVCKPLERVYDGLQAGNDGTGADNKSIELALTNRRP